MLAFDVIMTMQGIDWSLPYGALALAAIGVGYLTLIGLNFFESKRTVKSTKS